MCIKLNYMVMAVFLHVLTPAWGEEHGAGRAVRRRAQLGSLPKVQKKD